MRTFSREDLQAEALEATTAGHTGRIAVLPRMGANLVSFQMDGREFIHFDPEHALADGQAMTGAFQMFPTVCRLTGCRYTFGGRTIRQRKHGEEVSIHGLVRDEPFAVARTDDAITSTLDITEGHPVYEGFPFAGRLTVTHRLGARGMEVSFAFENRGDSPAPVGWGVHPYWRAPGERSRTRVRVPGDYLMELVDLIPNGRLIPVEGAGCDLRQYRWLEGLDIDAVFYPKRPEETAGLEFHAEGIRLSIQASASMRHMICYAPAGQPFLCVENLTCAPDAHNLYAAGHIKVSGLQVVEPGQQIRGWIRYTVEEL